MQARKSVVGSQLHRGSKAAAGSPLKDGGRGSEAPASFPSEAAERSLTSFWDWHTVRPMYRKPWATLFGESKTLNPKPST